MSITLESFDAIINPGISLVAAPHAFAATQRRLDSMSERASIRRQIESLHAKAGLLSYDDELLRQSDLRRRQQELGKYPTLVSHPVPTYIIVDSAQDTRTTRHGKA